MGSHWKDKVPQGKVAAESLMGTKENLEQQVGNSTEIGT